MRRLAAVLTVLAAASPALAADSLPPALDKLLWCSSALYWLASDAYDGGDDAEGKQYQDWSDSFAGHAASELTRIGKSEDEAAAIADGYDGSVVDDMKSPKPRYDVIADCLTPVPAH